MHATCADCLASLSPAIDPETCAPCWPAHAGGCAGQPPEADVERQALRALGAFFLAGGVASVRSRCGQCERMSCERGLVAAEVEVTPASLTLLAPGPRRRFAFEDRADADFVLSLPEVVRALMGGPAAVTLGSARKLAAPCALPNCVPDAALAAQMGLRDAHTGMPRPGTRAPFPLLVQALVRKRCLECGAAQESRAPLCAACLRDMRREQTIRRLLARMDAHAEGLEPDWRKWTFLQSAGLLVGDGMCADCGAVATVSAQRGVMTWRCCGATKNFN